MNFIDSHAHIYLSQFDADRDEMIQRALESNVSKIVMPNIDHSSIDGMMEAEEKYPGNCFATMGLHPCSVKEDFEKELYVVENWLGRRKFQAIGETGIDLYWDKTYREQQIESLRIQAEWAKKHNLPLILHTRESFDETIEVIEDLNDKDLKGVFHCFTGTEEDALRIDRLGNFYMGVGGVATFKNGGLDSVLPLVNPEKLLLETDSPYLAPVPYRGKRNESAYIPLIAERIAGLMKKDVEEIAELSTSAAEKLFRI